jgi:hypothetical protein
LYVTVVDDNVDVEVLQTTGEVKLPIDMLLNVYVPAPGKLVFIVTLPVDDCDDESLE